MKVRFIAILLVSVFAASLFGASTAMAEPREKVLICHYDDEYGYWKLIDISGNAVEKHFANHDDAVPGGVTSQTGTVLDEYCQSNVCGNCLEERAEPGCENSACEAAVCASDPFCCDVSWDGICVGEAFDICVDGGICEG